MLHPTAHTISDIAAFLQANQHLLEETVTLFVKDGYVEPSKDHTLLTQLESRMQEAFPIFLKKQGDPLPASPKSLFVTLAWDICNDLADIQLLHSQSNRLVIKYTSLIHKRVKHFVFSGTLQPHDENEYIQAVSEQLLLKVKKGHFANFEPQAKVSTFMQTVIDNLIKSELKAKRHRNSGDTHLDSLHYVEDTEMDVTGLEHTPAFQAHVQLLGSSFKGFPTTERHKLALSLKVVYRIMLLANDIRPPYHRCTDDLLVEILSIFGIPYGIMPKSELFTQLTWAVNELNPNQKKMTSDGLRKWFARRLQVLLIVVFNRPLNAKEKKTLDSYFELVVYGLYGRL